MHEELVAMALLTHHSSRFNLPPAWSLRTIEPNPSTPLPDLSAAVEGTLSHPLHAPPLIALASTQTRVCVVFTDATRACPDDVLIPAILQELERAGVPDDHITLLCAIGLHRPSTLEEKIAKLGSAVVERYRVIDHDPQQCVVVPGVVAHSAQSGVAVNALLLESDLIIATGVVEPHQYAGHSGGGKTVVIGCGSERTIELTHGPQFLEQPGVRLGRIEGNPFQQFVREAAQAIGLKFVVNVVLDGMGQAIAVQAGDPNAVHDALVPVARSIYEVPVSQQFDVVIADADPPKDVNLYQASRAVTYVGLSAASPIRPGGVIILGARCPEGAGQGVGERRFYEALSRVTDLEQLLKDFRVRGCRAGEQRAFMLAQVLLKQPVIVVGSRCPEVIAACHMLAVASWDEAIARAEQLVGPQAAVLYLPHPLHTLPSVLADRQ